MKTYEVCVFLSTALDEQEEAETFEAAKERARDYIAHELEKRGLRPEKSDKSEAVDGYDGERFVCEFYGFDEP